MKKFIFLVITIILTYAFAALPPTQLKGGNESGLSTTFNFNLGQIPVTRTGTNVTFGTIPVTQGGTSATSLTQYSLMSGNGTDAVNMIAPGVSGTLLFSNGASAFPSYRAFTSADLPSVPVSNITGVLPLSKGGTSNTAFAAGSVIFSDGTKLTENNQFFSWDDANQRFTVGTGTNSFTVHGSTKGSVLTVSGQGGSNAYEQSLHKHSNTLNPVYSMIRSQGSSSAPSIVSSGNILGEINFLGYDGTDYEYGAKIDSMVDGTPGNDSMPSSINLYTVASGTFTPTRAMKIGQDRIVTLDAYGSGVLQTNSSGVVSAGTVNLTSQVSNVLPVVNGGTGVSSTVAQGVLVGSGTTSYRIASPASAGAVLMQSVSGTTAFLQPQPINVGNLLINGGFETYDSSTGSFYGWSSSSSGDIGNWTSPSQWDLKYWRHTDTAVTLGTDIFQTVTIPSSLYGQNCEFGFDYTNTNTSGTVTRSWYVSGTSTVSGTFSSSGTSSIKAFLPCGTASDTTKVVNITTTNASASGVTSVDNVYFGPAKSLVNGAIVGPTQTQQTITIGATTTAPTKGTIAQDKIEWNRDGEYIVATYRLHTTTAGTAGSGDYLISLPNGLSFDSGVSFSTSTSVPAQEVNAKQYGFGTISDGTNNGYVFPVPYDSTRFKLGEVTNAARSMFNSASNINFSGAVGLSVTLRAKIQGWSGSGVTYESRCPNDISCANEFSAKVSGTTVTSENLDWISSVGLTDTSLYTIIFNSGVFTDAPNCTANASRVGIPSTTMSIESVTSSTVAVRGRGDTGALQATDFFVQCNKSTDYVAKKTITGYLSNTVTTSGQYLERMVSARFAGASATTVCSSTPCTLYGNPSPEITSVSRSATGVYSVNFATGTFATGSIPQCFFTLSNAGADVLQAYESTPYASASSFPYTVTNSGTFAAKDVFGSVMCRGIRP